MFFLWTASLAAALFYGYLWSQSKRKPLECPNCDSELVHEYRIHGHDCYRCLSCGHVWRSE